jgi:hypothetical protein
MAKKVEKNKIKETVKEKPKPKSASKTPSKPQSKVVPETIAKSAPKPIAKPKTPIRNVIVSYAKIDDRLKLELIKKYPEGYAKYVHRYPKPDGDCFYAVPLDVDDMHYLIKVEVKVDNLITEDEFDKQFGDIAEVDSKAIGEVEVDDEDDDEDDEQLAEDADDDEDDDNE